MAKKFTTNCDFGGQSRPVTLYVGNPSEGSHPLAFQNKWLSQTRGGNVPPNVMDSFSKLSGIAEKNKVPFEDLCEYVIDEIQTNETMVEDSKKVHSIAENEPKKAKLGSKSENEPPKKEKKSSLPPKTDDSATQNI